MPAPASSRPIPRRLLLELMPSDRFGDSVSLDRELALAIEVVHVRGDPDRSLEPASLESEESDLERLLAGTLARSPDDDLAHDLGKLLVLSAETLGGRLEVLEDPVAC